MAWSSLADNQMVSYADAWDCGFYFVPGRVPPNNNQCVSKEDALYYFQIGSTPLASYANNQLIPKSVWVATFFSHWYYQSYTTTTQTTSGTVTITGTDATFLARAVVIDAGGTCNTSITINGTTRSIYRPIPGTSDSTSFTLSPGTYSYSVTVTSNGGGFAIAGGIVYTQ